MCVPVCTGGPAAPPAQAWCCLMGFRCPGLQLCCITGSVCALLGAPAASPVLPSACTCALGAPRPWAVCVLHGQGRGTPPLPPSLRCAVRCAAHAAISFQVAAAQFLLQLVPAARVRAGVQTLGTHAVYLCPSWYACWLCRPAGYSANALAHGIKGFTAVRTGWWER